MVGHGNKGFKVTPKEHVKEVWRRYNTSGSSSLNYSQAKEWVFSMAPFLAELDLRDIPSPFSVVGSTCGWEPPVEVFESESEETESSESDPESDPESEIEIVEKRVTFIPEEPIPSITTDFQPFKETLMHSSRPARGRRSRSPTPTRTPTPVRSPTPVRTPSPVRTPTPSRSPTPSQTLSPSPEPTPSPAFTIESESVGGADILGIGALIVGRPNARVFDTDANYTYIKATGLEGHTNIKTVKFSVEVETTSDIYVSLLPEGSEPNYEILIGGWDGTRTVIKTRPRGDEGDIVATFDHTVEQLTQVDTNLTH